MKTVMCFGTFDLLHLGHFHYFEQARKYGDYLLVVIARDATKKQQKKPVLFLEKERQKMVQSLRIVDEAVLGNPGDHLKIILKKKPDVLCLGYDHSIKEEDLRKKLAERSFFPEIRRALPYRPERLKSSLLKKVLKRQ